jgi:putative SOS response-associated peptidase YedK
MDQFWLDPPGPNDPTRSARVWDAIVSYTQPLARRMVRPLLRSRIVVVRNASMDIIPALFGLVPTWAASGERRGLALRHTVLDSALAPDSSFTGDIWAQEHPTSRCLVPASGWLARNSLGSILAFAPELPPVTLAGMYSTIRTADGEVVDTFGVFVGSCSFSPYDGSPVPIVIRQEDRKKWMSAKPQQARSLLKIPGMKVHVRRIHDARDDIAIYGAVQPDD